MKRPSGDHVTSVCRPGPKVRRVSVRWTGAAFGATALLLCGVRTAHHQPAATRASAEAMKAAAIVRLAPAAHRVLRA